MRVALREEAWLALKDMMSYLHEDENCCHIYESNLMTSTPTNLY